MVLWYRGAVVLLSCCCRLLLLLSVVVWRCGAVVVRWNTQASTEAADKVFNLQGTRWTVFEGAANWWGDEAGAPKLCADKEKTH